MQGTRDYALGRPLPASVVAAAGRLGLQLPRSYRAALLDHAADIVSCDLLLVMDKYTAADVLREVSAYDLISKDRGYTRKVRWFFQGRDNEGSRQAGAPPSRLGERVALKPAAAPPRRSALRPPTGHTAVMRGVAPVLVEQHVLPASPAHKARITHAPLR